MASPPSWNFGTVKTVISQPKNRLISGPCDVSVTAIGPQIPGNARLEGAPRVPPIAATRKHTPLRPVYDDFATAHSSITSRSTNGRSRDMLCKSPKKHIGLLDRGRPLPRRAIKSLRHQKKQPKDEALVLPMLAKVSDHRPISEFDFDISDAHFTSGRQLEYKSSLDQSPNVASPKRASVSPFLDSLKKAIGGKSSPVTKLFQNRPSLSFKWPRDSIELSGLTRKLDQPSREDGQRETRPPQQSDETRLPELSFYLDDPFVYEVNQNPMSVERMIAGHNEAYGDSQHNREGTSFHDNYNAGTGQRVSRHKPTVQTQETLGYFHGGIALAIDSQVTSSAQEGSTVNNIVKQYARNNGLWDISLDSNDEDSEEDNGYFQHSKMQKRIQNGVFGHSISGPEVVIEGEESFRDFKLIDSSGRAPSAALPQIPSLPDQRALKYTSEGLGQSSSYGDTRNLLETMQRPHWVTTSGPPTFRAGNAPRPGRTAPGSTNLFRRGPNQNLAMPSIVAADSSPNSCFSHNMALDASNSTETLSDMPLLALERDISIALRRMSAVSNYSQEITAHYQGDGGFQSSTDSSGLQSFIGKPNGSAPEPLKLITRGFYHESAIRQTWLDSQRNERVRIPIRCNVSASSSIPVSHSTSSATDRFDLEELDGLDQNGTEWETVVDGVMSRVKTAGSSLANNSSAGDISPILFEYNDFSSTDRIVQHPAQIDYSHDYRYREIKEGKFPVLLPSYKPHTVNGFPANSYRSINLFQQSSGDLYQPPPPLSRNHANPFRSPPPEVITNKSASSQIADQDRFVLDQLPKLKLDKIQTASGDHSTHWMDGFVDPGPAIRPTTPVSNLEATNHSTNSLTESYTGSQIVGSIIADASSSALSTIIHKLEGLKDVQRQGTSRPSHDVGCIDDVSLVAREREPFIKGPPGAFYQGVRSRPDPRRKDLPADCKAVTRYPQRKVAQNYPTNQMRPLSLLQVQRAEPTVSGYGSRPGGIINGNFVYRSPLAPIKSKSRCNTREQLSLMHIDANTNSINDFEYLPQRSSRPAFDEALKSDGSWKRTWSPHLRPWPRNNSSIKTDLSGRKEKLSSLIFGLCCLFPPMLVLYGVGYLDNMMLWITKGEISSFSKAHKKAALQGVCFFIVAILIAVVIIVAVKVIGSK